MKKNGSRADDNFSIAIVPLVTLGGGSPEWGLISYLMGCKTYKSTHSYPLAAIHNHPFTMADNQEFPASNLTWRILRHAQQHNYAVGAYNWYVLLVT